MAEWFEDDAFWREVYPHIFDEERWAAAETDVERVIALTGVTSGAVLDLCCGPGRHSAALARRGFTVTGIDGSPFLLDRAREGAGGLAIEFLKSDMREFSRPAAFDLAINLFTSFGYFATREEDFGALRNARESLKPGGKFVIEVMGRENCAGLRSLTFWSTEGDEIFVRHAEPFDDWTRLRNEWILIQDDRARRFSFDLNLYSGQELKEALHQAGFEHVQLFGSFAGAPYDAAATRLVAMAQRT